MGEVVRLPLTSSPKLGFRKAKRKRNRDLEKHGQLSLFPTEQTRMIQMHLNDNLFLEALSYDELDDQKAEELYKKAIQHHDSSADAHCNLGILQFRTGKVDQALQSFTDALKQDQEHMESHYNLANLYFDQNNYEPAKVHYEIAKGLDPEFPNVYFNLGLVLASLGNYKDAIENMNQYKQMVGEEEAAQVESFLESLRQTVKL